MMLLKGPYRKTNDIILIKGEAIMSIGKRIKQLRKNLNLTQNVFGKKLNINSRQLARYEEGINIPSVDNLMKIADYCEVSLDFLVYGMDKKLARRSKINDTELIELVQKLDRLKKSQREKIKWTLEGLLSYSS